MTDFATLAQKPDSAANPLLTRTPTMTASNNDTATTSTGPSIPITAEALKPAVLQSSSLAGLFVIVAIAICAINRNPVFLEAYPMSEKVTGPYSIAITFAATLLTTLAVGELRRSSIRMIQQQPITTYWRMLNGLILGLAPLSDQFKLFRESMALLVPTLITVAVVGGLSPYVELSNSSLP